MTNHSEFNASNFFCQAFFQNFFVIYPKAQSGYNEKKGVLACRCINPGRITWSVF